MLKYNLCFIRKGELLLMLNRRKAPLMGLWNGVGGKLEPGETPDEAMQREIYEETGITGLKSLRFTGTVTWELDGAFGGGMYVYLGEAADHALSCAPVETDEGILAWRSIEWVCDPENKGVAVHVRHFLPPMLAGREPMEYRCTFQEGLLLQVESLPLRGASSRD